MKLMFHKQELYGHWFRNKEDTTGFTSKAPPHIGVEWCEELNEWVLKPIEEPGETPKEGDATE